MVPGPPRSTRTDTPFPDTTPFRSHLDGDGFRQITDRSKDVIKSGGEWISSIELENIAMAHPAIAEVAVIGVKHPKWDERPVIVEVKKTGRDVRRPDILAIYSGRNAKWRSEERGVGKGCVGTCRSRCARYH